jgi:two-component system, LuxR family, response regulator FixJ
LCVMGSKVYFVDDDELFLSVTSSMLTRAGFVVTTYLSAADLLKELKPEAVGCVLADLNMPGMNGLDLQEAFQQNGILLPMVFLTGAGDIPSSVQAMKHGAEDFIIKGSPKDVLIAAINQALARNQEDRSKQARRAEKQKMLNLLTERELEVLKHVVKGELNKQIADDLGIHERTVKLHRTSVTTKLGMPSVAELTKFWVELNSDANS